MLPLEINIFGIFVPGLLMLGVISVLVMWIVEGVVVRLEYTANVWHPALFRVAVYFAVLSGILFCQIN